MRRCALLLWAAIVLPCITAADSLPPCGTGNTGTFTSSLGLLTANCTIATSNQPVVVEVSSAYTFQGIAQGALVYVDIAGSAGVVRLAPGSTFSIYSLGFLNAAMGPAPLQLGLITGNASTELKGVAISTDCLTFATQVQLLRAVPGLEATFGSTFVYISHYTSSSPILIVSDVNVSCSLMTLPAPAGLSSYTAQDTPSLYNAIAAASNFGQNITSIKLLADITVSGVAWPAPIPVNGSIRIFADAAAPLILDWNGLGQLVVLSLTGKITFENIDHMNAPPLQGQYLPFRGQLPLFTIPLWPVFRTQFQDSGPTVVFTNCTLVLPSLEFTFFSTFTLVLTTTVGPVVQAAAELRATFSNVMLMPNSPASVLRYLRFQGLGLNGTNFTLMQQPVARASTPFLFADLPSPSFNIDLAASGLLTAAINCFKPQDLVTGLQQLQDSHSGEQSVLVYLWQNMSMASVQSQWPKAGFNLANITLTFVGPQPGLYISRPYAVLDLATIPQLLSVTGSSSNVMFVWLTLLNLPTTTQALSALPPSGSAGLQGTLAQLGPCAAGNTVLGMPFVNMARSATSGVFFNFSTVVLPALDAFTLGTALSAPSASSQSVGLQVGSNGPLGLTTKATQLSYCGFTGIGSMFSASAPTAGFNITYNNSALAIPPPVSALPSPPPVGARPAPMDPSSAGFTSGQIAGIAVGSAVGGVLLMSAIAWVIIRQYQHELKSVSGASDKAKDPMTQSLDICTDPMEPPRPSGPKPDSKGTVPPTASVSTVAHAKDHRSSVKDLAKSIASKGTHHEDSAVDTFDSSPNPSSPLAGIPADDLHRVFQAVAQDIDDEHLKIQSLIGQGGFGTVYKGLWKGLPVAVKTLIFQDKVVGDGKGQQAAILEAAISSSLAHPYVVTTYTHDIKPLQVQRGQGSQHTPSHTIVSEWKLFIVQEFCDSGSLRQAVLKQKLYDADRRQARLDFVLDCSVELASGLAHLHSKSIIHGDLNPNNVLLKRDNTSRRGVVCKLCDFGLSIKMEQGQTHISNMRRGTPYYTAPEVLAMGKMTKAADIFSFGVMLWEMYSSQMCYKVLPGGTFAARESFPQLPAKCPRDLQILMLACMAEDPAGRPSASVVDATLRAMQVDLPRGRLIALDGFPVLPQTAALAAYDCSPSSAVAVCAWTSGLAMRVACNSVRSVLYTCM